MNAHRQEIVNVELTVEEVRYAIECAILSKYPFLDQRNGWDLQDTRFHEKNLHSVNQDSGDWSGATYFFVKDVEVDDAPLKEGCGNCLKPCK